MVCICGARLPVNNPVSVCNYCLNEGNEDYDDYRDYEDEDYGMSMDGDFDSGMASAGFGMDEDYGYYGDETDF